MNQPFKPWMSEFWTLLLGLPVLLAFVPHGGAEIVLRGFQAIALAPDWFKWSVGAAISLAFGIRGASTVAQHLAAGKALSLPPQQTPAQGAGQSGATDHG